MKTTLLKLLAPRVGHCGSLTKIREHIVVVKGSVKEEKWKKVMVDPQPPGHPPGPPRGPQKEH